MSDCAELKARLEILLVIVNAQAENVDLWFGDDIGYVRDALRSLHACIEAD